MNYKAQNREKFSPGRGYHCKNGTHSKVSPQTLSSIVSVMIPTHMYSSSTSFSRKTQWASPPLVATAEEVLAPSWLPPLIQSSLKQGNSPATLTSPPSGYQTDSVSHLRGTAAYILGRFFVLRRFFVQSFIYREIGEKYGVD